MASQLIPVGGHYRQVMALVFQDKSCSVSYFFFDLVANEINVLYSIIVMTLIHNLWAALGKKMLRNT